ncbi:MAG: hypothetical protein ABIV06_08070 [Thermoanaerobaculia bacterium]
MSLPDQLADLERKVSARFSAALAEIRQEMRRAVEVEAQRASSAMLQDLDAIRPPSAESLLAKDDLLEITREAGGEARRTLARSLREAIVEFDRARTQNAVLEALLTAARPFGDHAALWLMRPEEIVGWASRGFAGDSQRDPIAGCTLQHDTSPVLAQLATGRGCVLLDATQAAQLASALEIAAPARALFLPLVLRDRVAAALYLDAADAGEFEIEALQLLALAAAQRLELQALATRAYTPTLFLEADAPAGASGLALWDPAASVSAAGREVPETAPESSAASSASAGTAVTAATWSAPDELPAASEIAWEAEPDEVAPAAPMEATAATGASDARDELAQLPAFDEPTAYSDFQDAPVASPVEAAGTEISWQMEEADETALMGSPPLAVQQEAVAEFAEIPPLAEPTWESPTPTHEIPHVPPAAAIAASEWREVEETTAPQATLSSAATQRFPAPNTTNEFPQPPFAAAPDAEPALPAGAATIAFVPPAAAFERDLAEDATLRLQRSDLLSGAPPFAAAPPPAPPAPPALPAATASAPFPATRPAGSAPGLPDDEPTVSRGPRTTEVAPPADLQGPGWAFSSTRSPRAGGDNALHEEARRLARLLVSEIKLYNEDQVEEGRHNRDIYHRLKDDIDRSRQIYEERVHESVRGTTDYFQQELIRSLAGGDARALGI